MSDSSTSKPETILIIGAGVFGLSTALSLLNRPRYASSQITIIDASPVLPNPSGSSVDSSRIIRADYPSKHYAKLASEAQRFWRDQTPTGWGGEGRYTESGFVLTYDTGADDYVRGALTNVTALAEAGDHDVSADKIEWLDSKQEIARATGYQGTSGDRGYANWNSGWADAGKCVAFALKRLEHEGKGRVTIQPGVKVETLLFEKTSDGKEKCIGARVSTSPTPSSAFDPSKHAGTTTTNQQTTDIHASLTILAAGAWTPSLINLQGRCVATGQALTYLTLSDSEQATLQDRPVIMNLSRGMFIMPPRDNELKVARHGYGYRNIEPVSLASETCEVSIPRVGIPAAAEAQQACREALREIIPGMGERAFSRTRVCWYCDTPTGEFLIARPPRVDDLVIATGGSGHGFKFFPVIGEKIVDRIEGVLEEELVVKWRWLDDHEIDVGFHTCEDGSRAGRKGMLLDQELAREGM